MIFDYILNSNKSIKTYFKSKFDIENINYEEINIYRTHAFKIQAFGRIIKRAVKKSELKKESNEQIKTLGDQIKLNAKFIEDSIGNYLYHFEMKESAKDDSFLKKAKDDLANNIKEFEIKLLQIDNDFKSLNILLKNDLKNLYLKGFKRELKKIKEDIEVINPNLLEDGTHELRRKMRWVIMHVIYPEGLFKYIEKNPETTKYTKLSPISSYDPVGISFEVLNFLSNAVYDLGKLKDKGLSNNYLKPHDQINESSKEVTKFTQDVVTSLLKKKYLKTLRSQISEHIT